MSQLLMTAMLGGIVMYIFACIAFLFISDNMFDEAINPGILNRTGNSVCMSLMHCFLSTVNYGLRFGGGMGDFFPPTSLQNWNMEGYWIRFCFDMGFNISFSILLLNVIVGIIIDTFA